MCVRLYALAGIPTGDGVCLKKRACKLQQTHLKASWNEWSL